MHSSRRIGSVAEMFRGPEFQVDLAHPRFGLLHPAEELLKVRGFGREEMLMLHFHIVDAETFGEHVWKVHDVKRPFRIVRIRGVLEDRARNRGS